MSRSFAVKFSLVVACLLGAVSARANCYLTGGNQLVVCHDPGDEGMYFQTPGNRVAYNTQIMKFNDASYMTVLHSESRYGFENNYLRSGDSIRVGRIDNGFTYLMPPSTSYAIWGSPTDVPSNLYYGTNGPSGGGNPMTVHGRTWAGDAYYYMFFLTVHGGSDAAPNDWRHYLNEARTLDFVNWDIYSMDPNGTPSWQPFTNASVYWQQRPLNLIDTAGGGIQAMFPDNQDATQGLIGSISIVGNVYYYFYTDYDATKSYMNLYVRTAGDVSQGWSSWSPAQQVNSAPLPVGTLIRIGKAKGMDRWAVSYGCVAPGTNYGDICLQYTQNLNVNGPGGISDLQLFTDGVGGHSSYALGLGSRSCPAVNPIRAQQDFMTDDFGNLASPNQEPGVERGGIITWTDYSCTGPGPYGAPVFRAGWQVTPAQ